MNYKKISFLGDFIAGRFIQDTKQDAKADGQFKDISPGDLTDEIMTVSYKLDHVERACQEAQRAYIPWARLSFDERKKYLLKLKDIFVAHETEMAEAIARDTGKALWDAVTEAKNLANKIDITINESMKLVAEQHIANALPGVEGVLRYKSRGVMAVIGPFNFPAHLPNGHIVPALLTGNTIVYKPSEQTPYVAQLYSQCIEKAEFPAGVFNMVHGEAETGRRLVAHELVDGILFTGSYEVGLKIKQETLNHYWKILALEMGGKNTTIVWDDADMDKAVYETIVGAYMSAGQRCSGTSKVILHDKIADQFTERFYNTAKKLTINHWSKNPFMGSLINAQAVEKYVRFQEMANRENCESVMRGKSLDLEYKGYYVTPSIHLVKAFDPKSIYQKTEIFGPNVAIYRSSDFEHALENVNSSGYGLCMALFTKNRDLYNEALLKARVGLLNLNRTTNGASSRLPFGGMGKSGNDRPSGHFAVQYCTVPLASLEDPTALDKTKLLPGVTLE